MAARQLLARQDQRSRNNLFARTTPFTSAICNMWLSNIAAPAAFFA
jgi:hypothetical protein